MKQRRTFSLYIVIPNNKNKKKRILKHSPSISMPEICNPRIRYFVKKRKKETLSFLANPHPLPTLGLSNCVRFRTAGIIVNAISYKGKIKSLLKRRLVGGSSSHSTPPRGSPARALHFVTVRFIAPEDIALALTTGASKKRKLRLDVTSTINYPSS